MKLTMPEGLGVLGAVIAGVLMALGSQAAQSKSASEPKEMLQKVADTAVDGVKDQPQDVPVADSRPTRHPTPVPPSGQRATSLSVRKAGPIHIRQLPQNAEGVDTFIIKGGAIIVSKSNKFGSIELEADEMIIQRKTAQKESKPAKGPNGETWIDAADLPMEAYLKGDAIFRQEDGKTAGKTDRRTVRAPLLHYNFVTGCLHVPAIEPELAHELTPVPPSGQRATSALGSYATPTKSASDTKEKRRQGTGTPVDVVKDKPVAVQARPSPGLKHKSGPRAEEQMLYGLSLTELDPAIGEGALKIHQRNTKDVVGMPDVDLVVSESKRVVDVGGTATFKIRLRNYGTKEATHILIRAILSPNLKVVKAGASPQELDLRINEKQNVLRFQSIDNLGPNKEIHLGITVNVLGPARKIATCRVCATHDGLPDEDEFEDMTVVKVAHPRPIAAAPSK